MDPLPSPKGGFCVWLTGLSGAGKSTLAAHLAAGFSSDGTPVDVLDGDDVRRYLSPSLGFSKDERDLNVRRMGWMASRLVRAGMPVIVAAVSPYRAAREEARLLVEEFGAFIEVFVDAPIDVCAERDVKGLYAQARSGSLQGMTGLDDPYERPTTPDVWVDTHGCDVDHGVGAILACLGERGLIGAPALLA